MTIELANRLQKLRKENGYSQDELADKLGISRQAVSKWERSESSPDTDNLIELAKLYHVSLDELIYGKEGERVLDENLQEIVDNKDIGNKSKEDKAETRRWLFRGIFDSCATIFIVIGFFVWGFVFDGFYVSWVLFVLLPALNSIPEAIIRKRFNLFAFPVFITAVYLFLGVQYSLWHPWWVLFLLIPAYHGVAATIDKYIHRAAITNNEEKKI